MNPHPLERSLPRSRTWVTSYFAGRREMHGEFFV